MRYPLAVISGTRSSRFPTDTTRRGLGGRRIAALLGFWIALAAMASSAASVPAFFTLVEDVHYGRGR